MNEILWSEDEIYPRVSQLVTPMAKVGYRRLELADDCGLRVGDIIRLVPTREAVQVRKLTGERTARVRSVGRTRPFAYAPGTQTCIIGNSEQVTPWRPKERRDPDPEWAKDQ